MGPMEILFTSVHGPQPGLGLESWREGAFGAHDIIRCAPAICQQRLVFARQWRPGQQATVVAVAVVVVVVVVARMDFVLRGHTTNTFMTQTRRYRGMMIHGEPSNAPLPLALAGSGLSSLPLALTWRLHSRLTNHPRHLNHPNISCQHCPLPPHPFLITNQIRRGFRCSLNHKTPCQSLPLSIGQSHPLLSQLHVLLFRQPI